MKNLKLFESWAKDFAEAGRNNWEWLNQSRIDRGLPPMKEKVYKDYVIDSWTNIIENENGISEKDYHT